MSSNFYEVALFGEFFSRDLKAILNRVTLHSESSYPMHSREIIFEPLDAQRQRESGNEPVLLRARKELGEVGSGWWVLAHENVISPADFPKGFYTHTSSQSPFAPIQRRL